MGNSLGHEEGETTSVPDYNADNIIPDDDNDTTGSEDIVPDNTTSGENLEEVTVVTPVDGASTKNKDHRSKDHRGKGHKGKNHKGKSAFKLPKGWQKKCKKDPAWCSQLIQKAVKQKATRQFFGGKAPPKLTKEQLSKIKKSCQKKPKNCVAIGTLQTQVAIQLSKRSGELAGDSGGLSTGALVGIIIGVLLLLGALLFYFFFGSKSLNGKKDRGTGGKSSSKAKSTRLKSKSSKFKGKAGKTPGKSSINSKGGKSRVSKISSHKSSKKSGKKSMKCKSTKTAKSKK